MSFVTSKCRVVPSQAPAPSHSHIPVQALEPSHAPVPQTPALSQAHAELSSPTPRPL